MTTANSLVEDHRHDELALEGARDPVCGMAVDPATAKHHSEHAGQSYYFCSGRCREKFEAEPERYFGVCRSCAVATGGCRRDPVDLPDASADRARGAW